MYAVFPGANISGAIDPIATNILPFIPTGLNGGGTILASASLNNTIKDNKIGQRVDFHSQKRGDWSFYYHFDDSSAFNQSAGGSYLPGFAVTNPSRAQMFMLSNTKTLGASMVNEARATFFRTAIRTAQPVPSFSGQSASLCQPGLQHQS